MSALRESFDCVGPGWESILVTLDKMFDQIAAPLGTTVRIFRVKEKFGGLQVQAHLDPSKGINGGTFYLTARESLHKCVGFAEAMSLLTCEVCGKPGESSAGRKKSGWVKTFCLEHHRERNATGVSPLQKFWEERNKVTQRMRPRD